VVHYAVSAWVVSITSAWARSGWQGGGLWWGEQGHGCFGEVAAVADLPFVVRLDQDTHDENRCRAMGLEKIPTTSVRLLTSRPALARPGKGQ
jgi:hypothetical protein